LFPWRINHSFLPETREKTLGVGEGEGVTVGVLVAVGTGVTVGVPDWLKKVISPPKEVLPKTLQ